MKFDSITDRRQFFALCASMEDGTISPEEFSRFESLLSSDAEARRVYVGFMQIHQSIRGWANDSVGRNDELVAVAAQDSAELLYIENNLAPAPVRSQPKSPVLNRLSTGVGRLGGFFSSPRLLLAIICASLGFYFLAVVALIPLSRMNQRNHGAASHDLASLEDEVTAEPGEDVGSIAVDHAEWSPGADRSVNDEARVGQRYQLASGTVELNLLRGTHVTLHGPAEWQLASDQRLILHSGELMAEVPLPAVGFTVATPTAEVVDLGTEFAVNVDARGSTDVHVLKGKVELNQLASATLGTRRGVDITAGETMRVSADGQQMAHIPLESARFGGVLEKASGVKHSVKPAEPVAMIWLGNLFDDMAGTSLQSAMKTDEFRATAEIDDLGVERVLYGGEPIRQISRQVSFDLTNLGWQDGSFGNVTNDAWTNFGAMEGDNGEKGGIRTRGSRIGEDEPKIDEGIGTHANALITFDLDEIRKAGAIDTQRLQFVCDRAGINDDRAENPSSSVHLAVLISDNRGVKLAFVDGVESQVVEKSNVWSIASTVGDPLRGDGRFVRFMLPIPSDAKYLTLVAACAGDGSGSDHAVWSGARLEVLK